MAPILVRRKFSFLNLSENDPEPVAMDIGNFDGGVGFQAFSQTGNKDIHAAPVKVIVVAPDFLQCIFTQQDTILGST